MHVDPEMRKACARKYRLSAKGRAASARASKRYAQTDGGKAMLRAAELRRKGTRADYEHKRSLRRLYGITPADYQAMFAAQKGRCAICESTDTGPKRRLCVDHDHKTGRVRGLLCNRCNQALGLFLESPIMLNSARKYLCSKNI